MSPAEAPPENQNVQFTEATKALESILTRLKSGNVPLEEAMTLFEQGISHLSVCQSLLNQAKGRVEQLVATMGQEGQWVTEPFGEAQ